MANKFSGGLLMSILAGLLVTGGYQYAELQHDKIKPVIITKVISEKDSTNKLLIKNYINTYTHLSHSIAQEIYTSIKNNSKEYRLNPILLTAIIAKESSFRSWIRHSTVQVRVPLDEKELKTKRIKTHAIGLTGVIWEMHKYRLIREGITKKSDLYDIDMSIKAMCVTLNYYRAMKPIKEHTKVESAVLRYYGITYNKGRISTDYVDQINNKIGSILKEEVYK